jgi:hypothetical protein
MIKRQKYVYKVVKETVLSSLPYKSVSPPQGCTLFYGLNRWTKPTIEGSGIFVFTNLDDAKRFAGSGMLEVKHILKCRYRGRIRHTKYVALITERIYDIERYWRELLMKKKPRLYRRKSPQGSCLVDAVFPVEVVA